MQLLLDPRTSGGRCLDSNSQMPMTIKEELTRVRQVSDMLCTGHAVLRDRYTRRALTIDLSVLGLSTWIVALAFVDPVINVKLTPWGVTPTIWLGLLSIGVFFLSIVQLKTDWKSRADAHRRTLDLYAEVKREAGYILASADTDETSCRRVLSRYDMASAVGIELPERYFLYLKRRHRIKVAISKRLDTHPSASIFLLKVKMWFSDNWRRKNDAR
jgi:hypothetical protein